MNSTTSFTRLGFIEQAAKLGYRQTRRQFDRSRIGVFWIPMHYLLHVLLIGVVFRYVWKDENFLLFFSYSYLSWRLLTDPIVESAHFWRSSHSYIWYIGVKPAVIVGAWFMANLIKTLLWLVPTLIFTIFFLGSFPKNIFAFICALILVRIAGSLVGYVFSFISARFWEVSETVNSIILLAYLLSPVFWRPERLGEDKKWLVEINPVYYFMEIPRNFALGSTTDFKVIAIALGLTLVASVLAYLCHKKFSKKRGDVGELMSVFLKVEDLSVNFRLNNMSASQKIRENMQRKNNQDIGGKVFDDKGRLYVEALKNISFELKSGDRLGIVGSNGAGKSTLMRAIAGIIPPYSGQVTYSGYMLAAFSANGGIEQDISVEDNIFYRANLLGYKFDNSEAFIEEILDWAEVPQYRHLPFRTLSPGMMARIGFALTTAFTCDILLIDEWIGVGDERFIKRARDRWEQMVDRAGILVVCSHSESIISSYCDSILRLSSGEVVNFQRTS